MYRHHRVSPHGRVKPARATPVTAALALLSRPPEVQSALGWVVREATASVLRRSDARSCTIWLSCSDGSASALLPIDNDGVPEPVAPGSSGTGRDGLLGRLAATWKLGHVAPI